MKLDDARTEINKRPDLEGLPPGQISSIECKLLNWLAAEMWTGQGEIVEVGSLYGKSTVCLARGMADNPCKKIGRLHAFDKWMADDDTEYMLGALRHGYRGSFRNLFDENTESVKEWIVPHEGDTNEVEWCGKPIEILFLDCSVSREFHEMLFRKFYPFLRKGSILIHQDYFLYRSYYLPLMMGKLSPYLPEQGNFDTSMVYQMTQPIPQEMFSLPIIGSDAEIVLALKTLISYYGGTANQAGAIIASMLVYFEQLNGHKEAAEWLAEMIIIGQGITEHSQPSAVINNLNNALAMT